MFALHMLKLLHAFLSMHIRRIPAHGIAPLRLWGFSVQLYSISAKMTHEWTDKCKLSLTLKFVNLIAAGWNNCPLPMLTCLSIYIPEPCTLNLKTNGLRVSKFQNMTDSKPLNYIITCKFFSCLHLKLKTDI